MDKNRMNIVETENLKDTIRRLERIIELRNEEIKILEEQLEDSILENQILRNSNSKHVYDSVCSKLNNVTERLTKAEAKVEKIMNLDKRISDRKDIQTVITCDEYYVGDRGWFGVSISDFHDLEGPEIFEGKLLGIDDNYDYCFITEDKEGNMKQFPYFIPCERVLIE